MNIYLHELDINEYGTEIQLPCMIEEYILKYVFFTDTVYLQGSSPLKRKDMFEFSSRYYDLFASNGIGSIGPLISLVLDPNYESLNHYIENRIELLEKNSSGEQNIEKTIYKENKAVKKAIAIDNKIISGDIKRRDHNVNAFFKQYLAELASEIATSSRDDFVKALEVILDYVQNNDFIQTFKLQEKIEQTVTQRASSIVLGQRIRKCYFRANAAAVNCEYHSRKWHLDYKNINAYAELIGLNRVFKYNWKLDRRIIEAIRNADSFKRLLNIYFAFDCCERFIVFCNLIKTKKNSNPQFWFYETALFKKESRAFQRDMNRLKRTVISYHEERG